MEVIPKLETCPGEPQANLLTWLKASESQIQKALVIDGSKIATLEINDFANFEGSKCSHFTISMGLDSGPGNDRFMPTLNVFLDNGECKHYPFETRGSEPTHCQGSTEVVGASLGNTSCESLKNYSLIWKCDVPNDEGISSCFDFDGGRLQGYFINAENNGEVYRVLCKNGDPQGMARLLFHFGARKITCDEYSFVLVLEYKHSGTIGDPLLQYLHPCPSTCNDSNAQ